MKYIPDKTLNNTQPRTVSDVTISSILFVYISIGATLIIIDLFSAVTSLIVWLSEMARGSGWYKDWATSVLG